ncbi:hypothetical protein IV203_020894 [Nitzschia inconspicua]|uniref:Uncharacterized protein n=1 Tax=Nitzschia inconspicua TaxID=303405 RepID=A0A9K3KFS1_9STRA|nr:hypothetical protein IV203_020894 [Nitzschia inconspicua]
MFRQQRAQEKEIGNKNEEQVASADSCGADCSENSQSEVPRPGAFISASSGAVDELANHLNTKRKQSSHRSAPKNCPSIGHSQVTRKGQKIHKSSHQRLGKDENFDSKFRQQKVQEHKIGNKNEEESASTDSWCGEFPQDGQLEGLRLGGLTSASSGACEEIIDRLDTPKKQPSHQSAPRKAAGIGRSRVTQKGRQRHESSHHSLGKDDALDYTFRQRRAQEERIGNKNEEEGASMDSWDGNCSQDGHSEVPHPGAFRSTLSDAVEEMIDEQPNWHSMLSSSNNDDGKTLLLEATLVEEADLIVSSILVTAIPDQRGEEDFSSSHTEATKHGYRRRRQVCILLGVFLTSCSKLYQDLQEAIAEGDVVGICVSIQVDSTPLQIVESDVTLVGCCPETKCVISGSGITPNLVVTGGNFNLLNVIIQNGHCDPKSGQGGGNLRFLSNRGRDSSLTTVDSEFHNGDVQAGGNVYVEKRGSVTFQRSVFENGKASKDSGGGAFVT